MVALPPTSCCSFRLGGPYAAALALALAACTGGGASKLDPASGGAETPRQAAPAAPAPTQPPATPRDALAALAGAYCSIPIDIDVPSWVEVLPKKVLGDDGGLRDAGNEQMVLLVDGMREMWMSIETVTPEGDGLRLTGKIDGANRPASHAMGEPVTIVLSPAPNGEMGIRIQRPGMTPQTEMLVYRKANPPPHLPRSCQPI